MLLQIDGWRGAGKGALWTLLDGHKDIFCSPVHDTSFEAFTDRSENSEWLRNKDIRTVRKLLNNTGYYKFEMFSHAKVFYLDFSAEGDRLSIPFNLDFYEFDKLFFSRLMENDKWSIEFIVETLYNSLETIYSKKKDGSITKYYVAMGGVKKWKNKNFHQILPNSKCIQVRRDIEGIISTISNRVANPLDKSSKGGYSKSFKKRIKEHEVEKILTYYQAYDNLVNQYPDTYYVVDFKNLVENSSETMRNVAQFLNIKFNDTLTLATRDGNELICNGKKYVGEVYDNPAELLTSQELFKISWRKNFYKFHKQNFFPLSKKAIKETLKKII